MPCRNMCVGSRSSAATCRAVISDALAAVAQFSGKEIPELDRVAAKLVPLQKADGHFGDPFSTGQRDQ